MSDKKAFTLIELLIVIAIIVILVGLGTASIRKARIRARDAQRKSDLRTIQSALEVYYNAHGHYPIPIFSRQRDPELPEDYYSNGWVFSCPGGGGGAIYQALMIGLLS